MKNGAFSEMMGMMQKIRKDWVACSELSGTEETSRTQRPESCAGSENISHRLLTQSQAPWVLLCASENKEIGEGWRYVCII